MEKSLETQIVFIDKYQRAYCWLAVGILILLWVQDEFSYDGFHKNAKNIYRVREYGWHWRQSSILGQ